MMASIRARLSVFGWRRIVFSFVVLAYLGLLGLINMLLFLPDRLGWLPYNIANRISAMGHFAFIDTGDTHNLIHELGFAFILGTAAVGLLAQIRRPLKNVAGQLTALIAWGALILTAVITNNWVPQPLFIIFGGLTLLATIMHPAGRGLFNWFSVARINRLLLVLVIMAAVPFLVYASTNIGQQSTGGQASGFFGHNRPAFHGGGTSPNQEPLQEQPLHETGDIAIDDEMIHEEEHAAQGHYRNMAALSFIVILVGILASVRLPGRRLAAWVAGFLPILLGFASVILPDAESSLGVVWGLTAIHWGVVFVAAAEFTRSRLRLSFVEPRHPNDSITTNVLDAAR